MNKDRNLIGNDKIEDALSVMYQDLSDENLTVVLSYIRQRKNEGGHFVVAVNENMAMRTITLSDKTTWFVAFTSVEEELKGNDKVVSGFTAQISELFLMAKKSDIVSGIILNPWNNSLKIDETIIDLL